MRKVKPQLENSFQVNIYATCQINGEQRIHGERINCFKHELTVE